GRLNPTDAGINSNRHSCAQINRFEIWSRSCLERLGEIHSTKAQQLISHGFGNPAFDPRTFLFLARQTELFASPRALDHIPWISGHFVVMNKNRTSSSLTGGLFQLVSPAAVIGQGPPSKKIGVFRGRIIDQKHQNLTLQVLTLKIIPVRLRCTNAVPSEYQRHLFQGNGLLLNPRPCDKLLAERIALNLTAVSYFEGHLSIRRDSDQWHGLEVRTISCRL